MAPLALQPALQARINLLSHCLPVSLPEAPSLTASSSQSSRTSLTHWHRLPSLISSSGSKICHSSLPVAPSQCLPAPASLTLAPCLLLPAPRPPWPAGYAPCSCLFAPGSLSAPAAPDYWLLAPDYWLLAPGYWLLTTGYWLLALLRCQSTARGSGL